MKNTFYILLFAFCINAVGQNLVPNPSFESYDSLPCSTLELSAAFSKYIHDWFVPTQGTCDIFSSLVNDSCFAHSNSTSLGAMGSQNPRTGNVMAGFISMENVPPLSQPYREYLSIKLDTTLIVGEVYEASFYISLANYSSYATNNIGMYFSNSTLINQSTYGILSFTPQINETSLVSDTAAWVKIGGTFQAKSAAQYLTIGNFLCDSCTNRFSRPIGTFPYFYPFPYYFIDDILVQKFSLRISKDTTICPGDSIELVTNTDSIIGWADKTNPSIILSINPTITVAPPNKTTYLAYSPWDTAQVIVNVHSEISLNLGPDTSICQGKSMFINPSISNAEYLWQDGSIDSVYIASKTGEYWVKVSHTCGIFYDTVYIEFIDCETPIEMPNVFTPNGDGINDSFIPIRINNVDKGELAVFNRFGNQVYMGALRSKGWDGTYNKQACSDGVYFWVVTYLDQNGETKVLNGQVTVSR